MIAFNSKEKLLRVEGNHESSIINRRTRRKFWQREWVDKTFLRRFKLTFQYVHIHYKRKLPLFFKRKKSKMSVEQSPKIWETATFWKLEL